MPGNLTEEVDLLAHSWWLGTWAIQEPWWESQLAAVVATGILTLAGAVAGFLLRPLIERRIRREQAEEAERNRWREHGVELVADLSYWIIEFQNWDDPGRVDPAREAWADDLRRRTTLLSRFTPDEKVRKIALRLRLELERVWQTTRLLQVQGTNHPQRDATFTRYDESVSEASFILAKLTEALGGERAPSREGYPQTLRHYDDARDEQDFEVTE
jgi:hypothetical protein